MWILRWSVLGEIEIWKKGDFWCVVVLVNVLGEMGKKFFLFVDIALNVLDEIKNEKTLQMWMLWWRKRKWKNTFLIVDIALNVLDEIKNDKPLGKVKRFETSR